MDYLNVARCFGTLRRRSQAFVVEACQDLHLTLSEYILLIKLYEHEGVSQEEMAGILYIDKAVVTRSIKNLEAKGFIYREKDNLDRRMKRLYITTFGRVHEDFLKDISRRWIDYLSEEMASQEIEALLKGFQKLADRAQRADFHKI